MPATSHATTRNVAAAIAAVCLAGYVAAARAQSPGSTPGQTPGLQGTGPRVEVQTSANGTLDIGGAGGADLNMTGENFRGSFGASRPQPLGIIAPGLPRPSVQVPFAAPDFNPSLPGPAERRETQSRQSDEADYPDLILPRFRSAPRGGAHLGDAGPSSWPSGETLEAGTRPDAWRYRYFRSRWWFWQPSGSWVYWDGARWQAFGPRP